jgi:hypothetical protein
MVSNVWTYLKSPLIVCYANLDGVPLLDIVTREWAAIFQTPSNLNAFTPKCQMLEAVSWHFDL